MNNVEIEDILVGRGVKPTANRILVLNALMKAARPVSLADLELALHPMDKASVFRVLELFAAQEVVHVIE
ncbi:MAG: transcriptional repressor, partial [Bacteroidales bacterium]|nr:transcriptional repressor [Bacteroidales bacterium]